MGDTPPKRRSYLGKTPEERDAERRERVLDQGVLLFAEFGAGGVSVAKLAAAGSISTRQFYEVFEDRDEAYAAVLDHASELLFRRLMPVEGEDLGSVIDAMLAAFFIDRDEELVAVQRLLFVQGYSASPELQARRAEVMKFSALGFAGLIGDHLEEEPDPVVVHAFVGSVIEMLSHLNAHPDPVDPEGIVEGLSKVAMTLFGDS